MKTEEDEEDHQGHEKKEEEEEEEDEEEEEGEEEEEESQGTNKLESSSDYKLRAAETNLNKTHPNVRCFNRIQR